MGGYARHAAATYLVGWDEHLVIKAGITNKQRWRAFCLRGARVELLHFSESGPAQIGVLESELMAALSDRLPRAFDGTAESESLLGRKGGGYLECFRAPDETSYLDALAACSSIMLKHPEGACSRTLLEHMHGRNGRTD